VRPEAVPPATSEPAIIDAPGTGSAEAVLGGRTYSVRWEIAGAQPPGADTEAFGLDELTFPLVVRGWEPGDRIHLAYGSKKLKKLFGEKHVGRAERESIPILAE